MPRDPFYNTKAWKWVRRVKLTADPLCEVCQAQGRLVRATDVDHIKAINAGGDRTDMANLQSLCHECHSRKTLYVERFGRDRVPVKGCDPRTGLPLDPEHPWNQEKKLAGAEGARPGARLSAQ
jgi:5-methylcytosine-specific restriction protein A